MTAKKRLLEERRVVQSITKTKAEVGCLRHGEYDYFR